MRPINAPYWIDPKNSDSPFPDVELALTDPNGLLGIGGDLSSVRLLNAYRSGIFPWYSEGQPILWWSPNPRMVLFPNDLIISRSLKKTLRKQNFTVTLDQAFASVMQACAEPRQDASGTWITNEMHKAYMQLHKIGYAHSVEAWKDERLVGGLYGISIGRIFFGESMFTRATDASKVAFVYLVRQLKYWQFNLIDCQVYTEHLANLGATSIPRQKFLQHLKQGCEYPSIPTLGWQFEPDLQLIT